MSTIVSKDFIEKFTAVAKSPEPDLATAALFIARLEYPKLEASRYLDRLDEMGDLARQRVGGAAPGGDPLDPIRALNVYLFEEERFAGNQTEYDDLRNSLLNAVLDRRTGIPITLSLVYLEVARRAGVALEGVNFPGHFLLRVPNRGEAFGTTPKTDVILDPFHRGAILSDFDCQRLLQDNVDEEALFDRRHLVRATKPQILIRMLVNLKRVYVKMRSFPQARAVAELLLALNPSALPELRDRGLLAYHLNDFSAALRDLEAYLRFAGRAETKESDDPEERDEHSEIWEHVKALRRRVASLS
jgi:regulator of sirC expression with transglutaminase-like and TPR domain